MNKGEYYTRMKKIQNRLSTDRCSLDEEHNLIIQKCYLKDKYIETCEYQLDQLTNNWNELEEWLWNELDEYVKNNPKETYSKFVVIRIEDVLDKMKEIKGNNNLKEKCDN